MRTGPLVALVVVAAAPSASVEALAQGPAQPRARADGPQMLDCTALPKSTDEAALVKRFGRENVASAKLPGAEGETVLGTAVFPKDPARRLEIYWTDDAKRRGLASIAVRGTSAWRVRTPGKARPSIGLDTTLDEMEEANERPFLVNGFGWDYGGYGAGWKGGKLAALEGGCSIGVRFSPDLKAKERAVDKVSGEKQFGSSDPALRAVKPSLSAITLDWPE